MHILVDTPKIEHLTEFDAHGLQLELDEFSTSDEHKLIKQSKIIPILI